MKRFKLFALQLRAAFGRIFMGLLVMAVFFGIAAAAGSFLLRSSGADKSELIRVAVVADDSRFSDYVLEMADRIPGVSSLCELQRMDSDEAIRELTDGRVGLIIDIPDDFYEKASAMEEAHLIIYTDGKPSKPVNKLLAMLGSASGLMEMTDAQILSMYDTMEAYDLPVSRTAMEWEFFSGTLARFEDRDSFIEVNSISAFGSYDVIRFYLTSVFLCMMLLGGVTLFGMYTPEQLRLERTLDRGAASFLRGSIRRICAMCAAMGVTGEIITLLLNRVLIKYDIDVMISTRFHICLWMSALSFALWIHLTAGIVGADSAHFRVVYVTLMLILLIASGVVVPAVYLPSHIRPMTGILPTGAIHRMLLSGMWDTGHMRGIRNINGIVVTAITDGIVFAVSVILYRRRQLIHD